MTIRALPTLITKEYCTLTRIAGPLIFVERIRDVAYNEIVEITGPDGEVRLGQVLEVDKRLGIVQVFAGTGGLDLARTRVRFT
ncbi:MAG TPA: V-type ATP synthase subunit B, partial [Anaerolineae bacterium]|nr:V-type ATP synthase subunit B [Anaerolineae bacterium]